MLSCSVKLRAYRLTDAETLAGIYRDAVLTIGPQAYSPAQVAAWAAFPEDMDEFRHRLARGTTLVAEKGNTIIAFGQLDPYDHLAFLYCTGAHARRGVGSVIYSALESRARAQGVATIHTEASRISRSFFARQGYTVIATECPVRLGIEFERFRMRKPLDTHEVKGTAQS